MTKTTSKKRAWCKSIALIPVFVVAICVFSTKIIAQNNVNTLTEPTNAGVENPAMNSNRIVTTDLIQEYNQIIEKYVVEREGRRSLNLGSFSKDDLDRMKELFLSMSPEQQATLNYTFQRRNVPDERIPTGEQFESWKNPSEYGVWLDGKRIENSELNRFQSSDFSHYFVSRLMRNAVDYGKYVYHLELNTIAYYGERKARANADGVHDKLHKFPKILPLQSINL